MLIRFYLGEKIITAMPLIADRDDENDGFQGLVNARYPTIASCPEGVK